MANANERHTALPYEGYERMADRNQTTETPLYVTCPQCRGNRLVYAITRAGNDFFPTVWGEFACSLCAQTGEAHRDEAARYCSELAEAEDE